jgi:hypothetical protein
MSKKFALIVVVLMVVPLLLTACSTKSRDDAEKYMNALLKGENEKALGLACESFKPQTEALLAYYKAQNIDAKSLDLKFDIGKGGNNKEIIVTGSYKYYGDQTIVALEQELTEKNESRIVLQMKKDGDNWCVSDKSKFGTELDALIAVPAPTVEPTAEPTVEPTVEPTKEPTAEPTAEPTVEPTVAPTDEPTAEPTAKPTTKPEPTAEPTKGS